MLEQIFIVSFIVMAIWATMWEGMIFGFIRKWLQVLPEKLQMPIFDCPICMSIWYGEIAYWIIWGNSIKESIIVAISSMGLNAIFVKMFREDD